MIKKQKTIFTGFTIIELLVSIAIIGIISAISTATYKNYQKEALNAKAVAESTQFDRFMMTKSATGNGFPPTYFSFDNGSLTNLGEEGTDLSLQNGTYSFSDDSFKGSKSLMLTSARMTSGGFTQTIDGSFTNSFAVKIPQPDSMFSCNIGDFSITTAAGNNIAFYYYTELSDDSEIDINVTASPQFDKWFFVVISYDNSTKEAKMIINGETVFSDIDNSRESAFSDVSLLEIYTGGSGDDICLFDNIKFWPFAYNPE